MKRMKRVQAAAPAFSKGSPILPTASCFPVLLCASNVLHPISLRALVPVGRKWTICHDLHMDSLVASASQWNSFHHEHQGSIPLLSSLKPGTPNANHREETEHASNKLVHVEFLDLNWWPGHCNFLQCSNLESHESLRPWCLGPERGEGNKTLIQAWSAEVSSGSPSLSGQKSEKVATLGASRVAAS